MLYGFESITKISKEDEELLPEKVQVFRSLLLRFNSKCENNYFLIKNIFN